MKPNHFRILSTALSLGAVLTVPALATEQPLLQYETTPIHALRSGDTILVGFRDLCEAVGYDVEWQNGTATATGDKVICVRPGTAQIEVNKQIHHMDEKVQLVENKTVLPVRALAEALSLRVDYDPQSNTAIVYTNETESPSPQPPLPDIKPDRPQAPLPDASPDTEGKPGMDDQPSYSEEDLYWLARIIEAEAGAESADGKLAVGNVVLNRVNDPNYPNSIYGVVFDTKYGIQFEPTANGTVYNDPSEESIEAAKRALAGENIVGNAIYFYNPSLVDAVWIRTNCTYLQTIGCHDFYV